MNAKKKNANKKKIKTLLKKIIKKNKTNQLSQSNNSNKIYKFNERIIANDKIMNKKMKNIIINSIIFF